MVDSPCAWRERNRWTVLIAACWVEATAGLSYVFGTYSESLKSELSYDQRHVNRLSVAKEFGDTVGLAAGFFCRVAPNWIVLLVGALLIFAGYGLLWLLVDHQISELPFWSVCVLIFIGSNGCTFLDTAALISCIPSFPANRATAVGLLKGFKGLCGAIFNQFYASFLAPDEPSFILLLAVGPAVVMIPLIFMMGPRSQTEISHNRNDDTTFRLLYAVSSILAAYMLGVALLQDLSSVSCFANVIFTVLLVLVLFGLLPIPKIAELWSGKEMEKASPLKAPLLNDKGVVIEDGLAHEQKPSSDHLNDTPSLEYSKETPWNHEKDCFEKVENTGANITLWTAFKSMNFWLLFVCVFFSMGSGTTAFNNLGQWGESLGYSNTQVFVSMTNIWNFFGRLAGGYASELTVRRYGHPRTLMLAFFQLLMAVGHVFYAMGWPGTVYVAVFLVAVGYGAHWAIFPTALSEFFGLENFGVLYNFVSIASPAGSLIYSGFIAGPFYDWEAKKQSGNLMQDTTSSCEGAVCFEATFLIMAVLCVVGAFFSLVLAFCTRSLYARAPPS